MVFLRPSLPSPPPAKVSAAHRGSLRVKQCGRLSSDVPGVSRSGPGGHLGPPQEESKGREEDCAMSSLRWGKPLPSGNGSGSQITKAYCASGWALLSGVRSAQFKCQT